MLRCNEKWHRNARKKFVVDLTLHSFRLANKSCPFFPMQSVHHFPISCRRNSYNALHSHTRTNESLDEIESVKTSTHTYTHGRRNFVRILHQIAKKSSSFLFIFTVQSENFRQMYTVAGCECIDSIRMRKENAKSFERRHKHSSNITRQHWHRHRRRHSKREKKKKKCLRAENHWFNIFFYAIYDK